jgi:hypothetical protein
MKKFLLIFAIFQLFGCEKPMEYTAFEVVYKTHYKQTLIYCCQKDKIRFKNGCLILDDRPVKCELESYKIIDTKN